MLSLSKTSGAHTTSSFTIPAGTTNGRIGFCFFNDAGAELPTSVSVDGQTATLIDSSTSATTFQTATYKFSGTSTGAGKTAAYTLSATGNWFILEAALEFWDGTPTYGAHNATSGATSATTSSLANSSGDLIESLHCSNSDDNTFTFGSGQSEVSGDPTTDATDGAIFGFTNETGSGVSDAQSITSAHNPSIDSTVIAFATGGTGQLLSGPTARLLGGKVR